MPLRLHGYWRSSAAYRVRIAVRLKGLVLEESFHSLPKSEQRQEAYLAINPQGLVPALQTSQGVITQSTAIIEYLDELFPQPRLLPAESHARAAAAQEAGLFADEIVVVDTPAGPVQHDQGIRPGTTVESLAGLKTPFLENGRITAGNASQISDGAAALLITSSERARELGLTPMARVHTVAMAGVDPVIMLTGPIPATARALKRSGLALSDIGAFEVNEAFASVLAAWYADTGADPALTNARGGAIALGHPLGASGARLMTTLVHRMRQDGIRYGLQTMCEGGGMANATILELM